MEAMLHTIRFRSKQKRPNALANNEQQPTRAPLRRATCTDIDQEKMLQNFLLTGVMDFSDSESETSSDMDDDDSSASSSCEGFLIEPEDFVVKSSRRRPTTTNSSPVLRTRPCNISIGQESTNHLFGKGFDFAIGNSPKKLPLPFDSNNDSTSSFPQVDFGGVSKRKEKKHLKSKLITKHEDREPQRPTMRRGMRRSMSLNDMLKHPLGDCIIHNACSARFPQPRHLLPNYYKNFKLPSCFQPLDLNWNDTEEPMEALTRSIPGLAEEDVLKGLLRIANDLQWSSSLRS